MARIRMIKPEFFDDPDLADLSMAARLLFIGLWLQADSAGRLADDTRRLKVRVFPYDNIDVEALAVELHGKDMIRRYQDNAGRGQIWIKNFLKHQRPHPKEPASLIEPCPRGAGKINGEPCKETAGMPESGSLDLLILDSGTRKLEEGARAPEKPQTDEPKWTHGQTRSRPGLVGNHVRCFHAPAACARGACVPGFLGQQWTQQLADTVDPLDYIAGIVAQAINELPAGPLGDDPITYWRAVWSAKHGSQAPAKAAAAKPSSAASMQRARETFMAEQRAKDEAKKERAV